MGKLLILPLSILSMLFFPLAGMAGETGYVVGHVSLKMTIPEGGPEGMPSTGQGQREKLEVEIARVTNDYKQTLVTTTTDRDGYFYLAYQPLDHLYRVTSIQGSEFPEVILSMIPPPNPEGGEFEQLFSIFSSRHEADAPIIDVGRTIIEIERVAQEDKSGPSLRVERRYRNTKVVLDSSKDNVFERFEEDYGYPGLEYYTRSGPKDLRRIAKQAIEDLQQFDKAEPLKEEADQLREKDKEAAISKYREAVQIYPAYVDAYDELVELLADMERKEEAVSALEDALKSCSLSDKLHIHCRLAAQHYMGSGDAKKAIPHYEKYLSLRPDNSWAIVYLAKAYIADSRFKDARDTVDQGNKSVIYYAVHSDFEKVNRLSDTKEMLQKAISTYSDGSLSIYFKDIEAKLAGLP